MSAFTTLQRIAVTIAAAIMTIAAGSIAAISLTPVARAATTCHVASYFADGHTSMRTFIRLYHPHAGLPGVLATEYTCAGGWDKDWSAYLRLVNRKGTGAPMPKGMTVLYAGAGPRP